MLMRLTTIAVLAATPALAQNTGTVHQPGATVSPTGTVQQPAITLQAPNYAVGPNPDRSPRVGPRPAGTADNAAQPSGTEFHQMIPIAK